MDCLPPSLSGRKYYKPADRGFEKEIKRRLDGWEKFERGATEENVRLRLQA